MGKIMNDLERLQRIEQTARDVVKELRNHQHVDSAYYQVLRTRQCMELLQALENPERRCYDCGVLPGEPHQSGCDIERCSVCHRQRLICGHKQHQPSKAIWTGEWPGKTECREREWYCVETHRDGGVVFRTCDASTPRAHEDLNRWEYYICFGVDYVEEEQKRGGV